MSYTFESIWTLDAHLMLPFDVQRIIGRTPLITRD